MITTKEAAKRLKTTTNNITLQIRDGKIKAEKMQVKGSKRPIWMVDEASLTPGKQVTKRKASKGTRSPRKQTTSSSVLIGWFFKHQDRFPGLTLQEVSELASDLQLE